MIILKLKSLLRCTCGATAMEYGLLASLVVTAIVGGVTLLGNNAGNTYNHIATTVK